MPLLKKSTPDKKRKGLFREIFQRNKNKNKPFSGSMDAGKAAIFKHKKRLKDLEEKMGQ